MRLGRLALAKLPVGPIAADEPSAAIKRMADFHHFGLFDQERDTPTDTPHFKADFHLPRSASVEAHRPYYRQ
jgi:hypothetical protein